MTNHLYTYLIKFLLFQDTRTNLDLKIVYSNDPKKIFNADIIIVPCGFFDAGVYGTPLAAPKLPLKEWEGIPLLFGEPKWEKTAEGKLLIYADVIASAYYLISRYEEMEKRGERDKMGRFPGKKSLPVRAGFIHRPIVDEYGIALRRIIAQEGFDLPKLKYENQFSRINFLHEMNQPFKYRGIKSFLHLICHKKINPYKAFKLAYGFSKDDAYFTFHRFMDWEKEVRSVYTNERCHSILFFRTGGESDYDKPHYRLTSKLYWPIVKLLTTYQAQAGLSCSFSSGSNPSLIHKEKRKLRFSLCRQIDYPIEASLHHLLSIREPEDIIYLIRSEIYHDYSMGYADYAGFRLGTSRPVNAILPSIQRLTELVYHPLLATDFTLQEKQYMGLSKEDAERYLLGLINESAKYGGELNLLYHNESFCLHEFDYQSKLYRTILRHLITIEQNAEEKNASKQEVRWMLCSNFKST